MLISVEKYKWSWVRNARSDVTVSTAPFKNKMTPNFPDKAYFTILYKKKVVF